MRHPTPEETFDKMVKKFEQTLTTKYLYTSQLSEALYTTMRIVNISWDRLDQFHIDAFKTALSNRYFGGCEPEFSREEDFLKWEDFTMDVFLLVTESELEDYFSDSISSSLWGNDSVNFHKKYNGLLCPWVNKSLPYYICVDPRYGTRHRDISKDFKMKWDAWKTSKTIDKSVF
jgi:hypothetical protein